MATSALHVTFLWEISQPNERMLKQYSEIETELSLSVEGADMFAAEVGDDILNTMNMYDIMPGKDGVMTKKKIENAISFSVAMAEVYLTVPAEAQPTLTDTMFKTGVTDAILSLMKAEYPPLKVEDSHLFSTLQMAFSTLMVALATKRAENDITRTEYSHQRLCRQLIPVLRHVLYNSPCLATVLILLKYLVTLGSTHKPFFLEVLEEFHGVVAEFLKPGVLLTHWNTRIPARQLELLNALTPYMPGEVNCFVNIISWFIFEIPARGMTESDLDLVMEKDVLLEVYWNVLNEPIPSTYFRYAKSKVMLFYSALCEEGPQYSSKLIEKFGVCPFLDSILGDVKVDKRSYFPLSCLAKNMIICLNPLHKDNIYPMDKAMEIIYEEFGKDDGLVQTEVLQYMPGMKKSLQIRVGKLLSDFATQLRNAFLSDFAISKTERKSAKKSTSKGVRFSGSEDDLNKEKELISEETDKEMQGQKREGGILANTVEIKQSNLQGYLENLFGAEYALYLPTYAQNGLYLSNKRKVFYNCLEEANRELMNVVCSVCNATLNKIQCKACSFKYCSPECLTKDAADHESYCSVKRRELSLEDAVAS